MSVFFNHTSILLIISGGIAAYKALDLIRLLRKSGARVRCILTQGGAQFVTPLSVEALSEEPVYTDLFSLKEESAMSHIRLSREADLIVVAPASANIIAQMAYGLADDLASTTLLAADKPVLIAPAMNPFMWNNAVTRDNIEKLKQRGVEIIGPCCGVTACGEEGTGRMSEPEEIWEAIRAALLDLPLKGKTALVTAGPTYEPLDPVRFLGNRSSGKQGYAIATALAKAGADVTLVSGPTSLPPPEGLEIRAVETAAEMLTACESALPVDIAVCAAAVSDWAPAKFQTHKIKKRKNATQPDIKLKENPDILQTISNHKTKRPVLVIGFAAETENLVQNAKEKLKLKNCDWIVGNAMSADENIFGAEENRVTLIASSETQKWPKMSKTDVAEKLVQQIREHFKKP